MRSLVAEQPLSDRDTYDAVVFKSGKQVLIFEYIQRSRSVMLGGKSNRRTGRTAERSMGKLPYPRR